ncbi:MAG: hypothetical protein LBB09_03445 [Rickettsiales bacterium]|nr:hypothetical protein [Rickettsiales bacterium]
MPIGYSNTSQWQQYPYQQFNFSGQYPAANSYQITANSTSVNPMSAPSTPVNSASAPSTPSAEFIILPPIPQKLKPSNLTIEEREEREEREKVENYIEANEHHKQFLESIKNEEGYIKLLKKLNDPSISKNDNLLRDVAYGKNSSIGGGNNDMILAEYLTNTTKLGSTNLERLHTVMSDKSIMGKNLPTPLPDIKQSSSNPQNHAERLVRAGFIFYDNKTKKKIESETEIIELLNGVSFEIGTNIYDKIIVDNNSNYFPYTNKTFKQICETLGSKGITFTHKNAFLAKISSPCANYINNNKKLFFDDNKKFPSSEELNKTLKRKIGIFVGAKGGDEFLSEYLATMMKSEYFNINSVGLVLIEFEKQNLERMTIRFVDMILNGEFLLKCSLEEIKYALDLIKTNKIVKEKCPDLIRAVEKRLSFIDGGNNEEIKINKKTMGKEMLKESKKVKLFIKNNKVIVRYDDPEKETEESKKMEKFMQNWMLIPKNCHNGNLKVYKESYKAEEQIIFTDVWAKGFKGIKFLTAQSCDGFYAEANKQNVFPAIGFIDDGHHCIAMIKFSKKDDDCIKSDSMWEKNLTGLRQSDGFSCSLYAINAIYNMVDFLVFCGFCNYVIAKKKELMGTEMKRKTMQLNTAIIETTKNFSKQETLGVVGMIDQ